MCFLKESYLFLLSFICLGDTISRQSFDPLIRIRPYKTDLLIDIAKFCLRHSIQPDVAVEYRSDLFSTNIRYCSDLVFFEDLKVNQLAMRFLVVSFDHVKQSFFLLGNCVV